MNPQSDFADEAQFRKGAEAQLLNLLQQLDEVEFGDFDPRYTPGSLVVQFEDSSILMLSMQTPTHELWLSANYTAWHFVCTQGVWKERDTQEDMLGILSTLFTEKLEDSIVLV